MIIRTYNSATGTEVFRIKGNKLIYKIQKSNSVRLPILLNLYVKIVQAFQKIPAKYIHSEAKQLEMVKVDLIETEDEFNIEIKGIDYIPPSVILKLLPLFMWYEIKYFTGSKPSATNLGKVKMKRLSTFIEKIKFDVNRLSSKFVKNYKLMRCNVCGEETYFVNQWRNKIKNQVYTFETPVCVKHKNHRL
jgi:hypothetical protein